MKNRKLLSFVVFYLVFLTNFSQLHARARDGNIKILVLIIDSDNEPIYAKLRKVWRAYMHLDPEHVVAYFIRGNPDLSEKYAIIGDTLWTKTLDNLTTGITRKTILSMECMFAQDDFDYVLRSNLSSFYVFPRLLKFLDTRPRERFYCSVIGIFNNIPYGSGCGFLLSKDLVKMLISLKTEVWKSTIWDDVTIGKFFLDHGVHIVPHVRFDFITLESWKQNKNKIPKDIFQFRVKSSEELRKNEVYIDLQLLKMFYNISLSL